MEEQLELKAQSTIEQWKQVAGYEGLYEVSDLGRVRSVDRIRPHGVAGLDRVLKGRIINPWFGSNEYRHVSLSKDGFVRKMKIATLVCDTFQPETKAASECVNHKDGNKENDCNENLEHCTYSQNNKHAFDTGLKKPTIIHGENIGTHKLSNEQVLAMRAMFSNGAARREISTLFNVHYCTACRIIRREGWKHI